jgi:hypothetical protein
MVGFAELSTERDDRVLVFLVVSIRRSSDVRKLFLIGLAFLAVAFVGVPAFAQTNPEPHHNGVEYFFFNPIVPPTNATTITRCFGSVSSIGALSGGSEGNTHPYGVQQDGFEAWNGQAGPGAGAGSFPLGFSLMAFRCGTSFAQSNGTFVAAASWVTSLPCSAPWFWIVTFGWGTAFTHTPTSGSMATLKNFYVHIRGETSQTIANQNYFTGSGNERYLNTGGISFLEDTLLGTAFQLVGAQEWSPSYYTQDAHNTIGRDPSGGTAGFGLDFGTGGKQLRSGSTSINPGAPKDSAAIQHQANQNLNGIAMVMQTILTSPQTGGGLDGNGTGGIVLPAGDGRAMNLKPDAILTGLSLSLSIVMKTGGALGGITGDVGLSGTATTIPVNLSGVSGPPALQPIRVRAQAFSVQSGLFAAISTGDDTQVD